MVDPLSLKQVVAGSSPVSRTIAALTDAEFTQLFIESTFKAELLRKIYGIDFNSSRNAGYYKILNSRLRKLGLVFTDSKAGMTHTVSSLKKRTESRARPIADYTRDLSKEDYSITSSKLKKKVLNLNLLENKCSVCSLPPIWQGKPITLQLDHIDGNHDNNDLNNLRIICPNCHSQTRNFAGKNIGVSKKLTHCECGQPKSEGAKCCKICRASKSVKIDWPTDEELLQMLSKSNYYALSKVLGCSDNAIRKRLRRNI